MNSKGMKRQVKRQGNDLLTSPILLDTSKLTDEERQEIIAAFKNESARIPIITQQPEPTFTLLAQTSLQYSINTLQQRYNDAISIAAEYRGLAKEISNDIAYLWDVAFIHLHKARDYKDGLAILKQCQTQDHE